jgi:hypothetical protein
MVRWLIDVVISGLCRGAGRGRRHYYADNRSETHLLAWSQQVLEDISGRKSITRLLVCNIPERRNV